MDEKEKIRSFVAKIVLNEIGDEHSLYEISEDYLLKKLYDEKITLQELIVDHHGYNSFFPEAGQIITSLSVLAGTIKTYLEIKKLIKENKDYKSEKMLNEWKNDLIVNGLSPEKADELTKKYQSDLKLLII